MYLYYVCIYIYIYIYNVINNNDDNLAFGKSLQALVLVAPSSPHPADFDTIV